MRLVIDTNVLVSAILSDGLPRKLLRSSIDGDHVLLGSAATINEFAVISRRKFKLSPEEAGRAVTLLIQTAELHETKTRLRVVKADPDDDRFLEFAVDGRADIVVSGDPHLLGLGSYVGVPIMKVASAVRTLRI